jgi:hypothetical protein
MKYNLIALACAILLAAGLSLTVTAGPTVPDQDCDGTPDASDNCQAVSNGNQWDSDQDGYGQFCDADYDQNGKVNLTDFSTFKAKYQPNYHIDCDHNCDGKVNLTDFATFQTLYPPTGPTNPGPSGLTCAGAPGSCPGTCP